MNIFFEDEVATVYHNNFTEIINDLKFDYVITDPPYNIKYPYPDYNDNLKTDEYSKLFTPLKNKKAIIIHYPEAICNIISKELGNVNKIMSWCYHNNTSPKAHRAIAFYNCTPNFNNVRQPYKDYKDPRVKKLVENGSTGARSYDWVSDIQIIKSGGREKNENFTNQIPIKLLERIILLTTKEGDTILDTFFGSGSLYFACKNTNRKCIGIEQSHRHLEVFADRVNKKNTE
jgi:DNA modification methylase